MSEIAIRAGYSVRSGGLAKAVRQLRAQALIAGGAQACELTVEGRLAAQALAPGRPLLAGDALLEYWSRRAGRCAGAMLRVFVAEYPKEVPSEDVAEVTGYRKTSGGFAKAIRRLRRLELVTDWRASDSLWRAMRS